MAGNLEPGIQISFWIDQKRYRGTFMRMTDSAYVIKSESFHDAVRVNAADIIWGSQHHPAVGQSLPDAVENYKGLLEDVGNQSDKYKTERDALQLKVDSQKSMLEYLRDNLKSLSGEIVIALQEDKQDD